MHLAIRNLLIVALVLPSTAWSGAVLFIYPTMVMFEGNERSATLTLLNRGDAIGTFETSWSELSMGPEGGLTKVDGVAPWSIQPYVRYSPRRVRLEPGESQVIKIALRHDPDAPEGEYYSHFRVLTLNVEDLPDASDELVEPSANETSVSIRARSAVAIPIIWRNSRTPPMASIEAVDIDPDENRLRVEVVRYGSVSVRGYLHLIGTLPDGKRGVLADPVPMVIYPTIGTRTASITLSEGLTTQMLGKGAEVVYTKGIDGLSEEDKIASFSIGQ